MGGIGGIILPYNLKNSVKVLNQSAHVLNCYMVCDGIQWFQV